MDEENSPPESSSGKEKKEKGQQDPRESERRCDSNQHVGNIFNSFDVVHVKNIEDRQIHDQRDDHGLSVDGRPIRQLTEARPHGQLNRRQDQ